MACAASATSQGFDIAYRFAGEDHARLGALADDVVRLGPAAAAKGMTIVAAEASDKSELDKAFNSLIAAGVQAVIVTRDSLLLSERKHTAELAMAAHVPTVHGHREEVEAGGLISYGVSPTANFRRAAYFVDKILHGVKPTDLPVEFPTKLEMVVNRQDARHHGAADASHRRGRGDRVSPRAGKNSPSPLRATLRGRCETQPGARPSRYRANEVIE
jgi:ABC transporter substrate binding protein